MPIVPRFVGQPDPSQAPEQNWAQGIQQAALAGEQLRRMGLETQLTGERIKDVQTQRAEVADQATIQQGIAQIPQNATEQDREMFVMQGILPKIKTDSQKALFLNDYAMAKKERTVAKATDAAMGSVADSVRRSSMDPGGQPFAERYTAIAEALQSLGGQNIDPDSRGMMFDALMKDYEGLKKAHAEHYKQQVEEADSFAAVQSMMEMAPAGSPARAQLAMLQGRIAANDITPSQALRAAQAIQLGDIEIELPGGQRVYMPPEEAAKVQMDQMRLMEQMQRAVAATKAAEERAAQAEERLRQNGIRIDISKEELELRRKESEAKKQPKAITPSDVSRRMALIAQSYADMPIDQVRQLAIQQLQGEMGQAPSAPAAPTASPEEEGLSPAAKAELERRRAQMRGQ